MNTMNERITANRAISDLLASPIDVKMGVMARMFAQRTLNAGCVDWTGFKAAKGYGRIGILGKRVAVHRLSWSLANSQPVPDGMFICHSCDRPSCFNPEHLFVGTQLDNMRDMVQKGRGTLYPAGTKHPKAKLTDAQALEIFNLKGTPLPVLSRKYGVSVYVVEDIQKGYRWTHITGFKQEKKPSIKKAANENQAHTGNLKEAK